MIKEIFSTQSSLVTSTKINLNPAKRNHLIDLLRFIAATWVVLYHFNGLDTHNKNWYDSTVKLGYLGVPVFFVISGYCVYIAANHAKNAKDFIIRRFFRIFPPYWFSIIIVAIGIAGSILYNGANSVATIPKTLPGITATVTLLTKPFSAIPVINWVYWTLTYELFFYLLIFIELAIPVTFRIIWFIVISATGLLLPIHDGWVFFFLKYWPSFCLGIILYKLLHAPKKQTWLILVLLILCLYGLWSVKTLPYNSITCIITALFIILNHFKPLKQNFFSTLGDYSYSIYLIHVPIGIYLLGFVKQMDYLNKYIGLMVIWYILLYSFIIFLAKKMYQNVELPFIAMGKKMTNKAKIKVKPEI